jgi:hypothetical protein
MTDDAEYAPRKGRDKLDNPLIPFTAFRITDADTYNRAVRHAYSITDDQKGGWRSPFTTTPTIKPVFDGHRCFQLEAWVEYWMHLGMKQRAEFPWLFDPHWSIRAITQPIPAGIRQQAGLVTADPAANKMPSLHGIGTDGFTRYRTPEGREAFRWAVLNLPPARGELAIKGGGLDCGKHVPTLRACYDYADPIEARARAAQ